MSISSEQIIKKTGFNLHIIPTKKFKTTTLVWKMKAPLTADTVTLRSLLPQVLQSSSNKFQTTASLRSHLDELYGAGFFVDVNKKGDYHIMSFTMDIANEVYLKDTTPLLEKAISFLNEIINHPFIKNDAFQKDVVEKEKRTLKQRIQSINDDKMRYASKRLVEVMCEGESYQLEPNGLLDKINDIDEKQLYQYYQQALLKDELHLFVIGNVDVEEVSQFADVFSFEARKPQEVNHTFKQVTQVNEVTERQDIKQGKLNIGFRTATTFGDDDYYALQVYNGIFGGFSHSKLFINVREKHSLAYYAASRIESHKGLMMVMSGVDVNNRDKAVNIIREQFVAMKQGDFSDDELNQTKAVIRNQILETIDTARGFIEILYHQVISKKPLNLDDWLEKIERTTRDEVVNVAQKIQEDTVYFLTGLEGEK